MAALLLSIRQWFLSIVGTLLFLPVYLFWGGIFSFSFTIRDSFCAWAFGLTACWFQILAMLASFYNPRRAAQWMVFNTVISMLLALGYAVGQSSHPTLPPGPIEMWVQRGPGIFEAGMIFWAPPLFFALLLLRHSPKADQYAYAKAATKKNR